MDKCKKGFTLIEVLIVISIIAVLAIIALMSIFGQIAHAKDANRKSDLYNLSKSFEDYFNDKSAYPDQSAFNNYNCGSTGMAPYSTNFLCDPVSKAHYGYFPAINGGYRICAKLTDTTDPAIAAAGCSGPDGCGLGGPTSGGVYNYCLSSGVTASAVGTVDQIVGSGGGGGLPLPTPTPGGGGTPNLDPTFHVVCSSGGACVWFSAPADHGCPVSWEFDCPDFIHTPETPFSGACGNSANRCTGG